MNISQFCLTTIFAHSDVTRKICSEVKISILKNGESMKFLKFPLWLVNSLCIFATVSFKNSVLSMTYHNVQEVITKLVTRAFFFDPTFLFSFCIFYAVVNICTPLSDYILYQKTDWLLKKLNINQNFPNQVI